MFRTNVRTAKYIRPYDTVKIDRSKFEIFFVANYNEKTEIHMRNLKTNLVMQMSVKPNHPLTVITKK